MLRLNGSSQDAVGEAFDALNNAGVQLTVSSESPLLQDTSNPDAFTALDVTGATTDEVRAKLDELGMTDITVESVEAEEQMAA